MTDRDYIHPLALAVLCVNDNDERPLLDRMIAFVKADRPLLTPRASAVMKALEAAENGECHGCECVECEECSSAGMLADDVMRAWRTP